MFISGHAHTLLAYVRLTWLLAGIEILLQIDIIIIINVRLIISFELKLQAWQLWKEGKEMEFCRPFVYGIMFDTKSGEMHTHRAAVLCKRIQQ